MNMKFDFRTKLLVIVLTMSLVAVLTSDILIYTLLGVLSVYLIIQGFGRQTIKYLIVCGIFIVLRLLSGGQGITILMPEMFLFMVLRILMMVMAAQPVIGMPPGEVVAVFKKIHAPDGIALPVTFMLRFFLQYAVSFLMCLPHFGCESYCHGNTLWTQWSILLHLLFSVHPE